MIDLLLQHGYNIKILFFSSTHCNEVIRWEDIVFNMPVGIQNLIVMACQSLFISSIKEVVALVTMNSFPNR